MEKNDVAKYVNSVRLRVEYFTGFLGLFRSLTERGRCREVTKDADHAVTYRRASPAASWFND